MSGNCERRLGRGTCDSQGCPDVGRATGSAGTETARKRPPRGARPRGRDTTKEQERGRQAPGTRRAPVLSPAARRASARRRWYSRRAASASAIVTRTKRARWLLHLADQVQVGADDRADRRVAAARHRVAVQDDRLGWPAPGSSRSGSTHRRCSTGRRPRRMLLARPELAARGRSCSGSRCGRLRARPSIRHRRRCAPIRR